MDALTADAYDLLEKGGSIFAHVAFSVRIADVLGSIFAETTTMNAPRRTPRQPQAALLGLAFDARDGQKRITRGKNFVLAGGSQDTHAQMQETAIKLNEQLDRQGRQLADVTIDELRDIVSDLQR